MYDDKYRDGGASVQIDPPRKYDLNQLEERIDNPGGKNLTPTEIGVLVKAGRVDIEDLEEMIEEDAPYRFPGLIVEE